MSGSKVSHVTAQDMELTASDNEERQGLASKESFQPSEEVRHEQDHVQDPPFQNVVFYLNPFLGRARVAELEGILCANGALKAQNSLAKDSSAWTNDVPTHIITDDLDFPDYKHAKARGINIVTPEWVKRSASSRLLQNPQYFSADPVMIFSGIVLTTTGLAQFDRNMIRDGLQDYGGLYTSLMTSDVTHMIAITPTGEKYKYAMDHSEMGVKVVLPHWLQQCINLKRRLPEAIYQFPDPPMQDPGYVVPKQVQGYAPQLYVNNVKTVTMLLSSPTDNQTRCLDGLHIHMASDLRIVKELKVDIEKRIKDAGGSLVDEYSSDTVDIVVCRYRAGKVYIKASRDGKSVGSPDWLLHVLRTRELSSPKASLLHYPVPLRPIEGMSSLVISITNYSGRIREYLKRLIQAVGATYLPTMSSRVGELPTTHLICGNASGEKYEKGNEWNIKVVNHLWLEESFQAWSLQSETRPRFTVFPIHNQLSLIFGAKILPDCLEEWIDPEEVEDSLHPEAQATVETSTSSEVTLTDMSSSEGQNDGQGAERPVEHIMMDADTGHDPEQRAEQSLSDANTGQDPEQRAEQSLSDVNTGQNPEQRAERDLSDINMVLSNESMRSPSPPISSKENSKKSSTAREQVKSDTPTMTTSVPSSPIGTPAGNPTIGSVRVVSRRRGAALQASKALQKIVPDMNEFQEELRDEKKASKRKKKLTAMGDSKDNDSMDMDVDTTDIKPSAMRKVAASPTKRKKTGVERLMSVGSGDDGDDKEAEANRSGPSTPTKKSRRKAILDKDKVGEDSVIELGNVSDQTAGAGTGAPGATAKQKRAWYITTGVKEQSASQVKALKALGIIPTTTVDKCTHLVATSITRTGKFLIALLQGKIIVREEWLQACIDANSILDGDNFRIEDPANEQKFDIRLYDSLDRAREKRVFENCVFYLSPSMKQEMPLLKAVVEAGGGKAPTLLHTGLGFLKDRLVKANQSTDIAILGEAKGKSSRRRKDNGLASGDDGQEDDEDDSDTDSQHEKEIVAVVSSEKDKDMWQPILDAGAHVYSHDVISLSVLTQKLDLGNTHALA